MPSDNPINFVHYLIVTGLNEPAGLEEFQLGIDDDLPDEDILISPLQKSYKPQVLNFFPSHGLQGYIDHEAVNWLCFPQGVSLYETPPTDDVIFHPFVITRENGCKSYAVALTYFEPVKSDKIVDDMNERCKVFHRELEKRNGRMSGFRPLRSLHTSKCLCLLLHEPFNRAAEQVLRNMYAVMLSRDQSLPLESYVYNALYEVPLPPPGRSVKLYAGRRALHFYRPDDAELPVLDYCLCELVTLLGVKSLLSLYKCVLLEQRVLIKSSKYSRLMLIAECLSSLIFPFSWAHVYVPILPASSRHFLDAPVPYIMGLCVSPNSDPDDEQACEVCLVDADSGFTDLPEDLPSLPYSEELRREIETLCDRHKVPTSPVVLRQEGRPDKDADSGLSSTGESPRVSDSLDVQSSQYKALDQSDALKQLEAIMGQTGVQSTIQDFINESRQSKAAELKQRKEQEIIEHGLGLVRFSACLREVFFNYMLNVFRDYEQFVIYPTQTDMNSWLSNREMMHNFDKEAFLGDQPALHLAFLCQFLETQMFATFIDNKIMSQWQDPDSSVKVFDFRNKESSAAESEQTEVRERKGEYQPPDTFESITELIEKHASQPDYVALAPHTLDNMNTEALKDRLPGVFPQLDVSMFAEYRPEDLSESDTSSGNEAPGGRCRSPSLTDRDKTILTRHASITVPLDSKSDHVNEAFLQFVSSLLKECKTKTKRMLVGKMGEDAVQLGHGDPTLLGLEENTMIASLCDLIERIWSHGLIHKQSKSPLWAHLKSFSDLRELTKLSNRVDTFQPRPDSTGVTGGLLNNLNKSALFTAGLKLLNDFTDSSMMPLDMTHERVTLTHKRKGSFPERMQTLQPLPDNLETDITHIRNMSEIHTDVGRARAFIRLALEKKVLDKRLDELINSEELLKSLYKRTAFLRSEDERTQALYHLQTLNTADYRCFTQAFTTAVISYRVLVFPGKTFAGGLSRSTANAWVSVAGQHCDSDRKWLPKNCLDFTFESKNLGVLSTVRIGHDNSGMAPKWLVDYVIVRNETTGQVVKFQCGRWLGRGVDDNSTERILVGEIIASDREVEKQIQESPRRANNNSPQTLRKPSQIKQSKTEIQQALSDSVNNLLKYFHKPEKERESVMTILCGETGLVRRLEVMLSMGFKSSRLFRTNLYIWDYLERVQQFLLEHDATPCRSLVASLSIINNSLQDVGKDGKLQLLLCLAVRDHLLPEWLTYLHYCPITKQMYDNCAYVLDEPQVQFLVNLLSTLRSYHIHLEPSITQGLDI